MEFTKTYTINIPAFPEKAEQLMSLWEATLMQPQYTAAMLVLALHAFSLDTAEATEMLNYIKGPVDLIEGEFSFMARKAKNSPEILRSYFEGATPENGYTPSEPLQLKIYESAHSRAMEEKGFVTLYVKSSGAIMPRAIRLVHKATGQWFFWEHSILGDVKKAPSAE